MHDNRLYRIQKKDIKKTGILLASAFENDPIWACLLKDLPKHQRELFFEGPARYGLMYGFPYAPSDSVEGLMVVVKDPYVDMTFLRILRAGFVKSYLTKDGFKLLNHLKDMNEIMAPLEASKKRIMASRSYLYLMVLGVSPAYQGQGYGKKMLRELTTYADKKHLPIYLETATPKNIAIYEKQGFLVTEEIMHPIINLPQWGMLREPKLLYS